MSSLKVMIVNRLPAEQPQKDDKADQYNTKDLTKRISSIANQLGLKNIDGWFPKGGGQAEICAALCLLTALSKLGVSKDTYSGRSFQELVNIIGMVSLLRIGFAVATGR